MGDLWAWCLEVLVPGMAHGEQGDAGAGGGVCSTLAQLSTRYWR
jgi:hypothetical protein